jgi:hypothetical protein
MTGQSSMRRSCAFMLSHIRFASVLSVCLTTVLSLPASAALIVDSLHYDGHVRINTTVGVEEHHLEANFTAPAFNIALPATNGPLTPPLLSANDLRITSVDFASPVFLDGDLFSRLSIWIQNTSGADSFEVFDNPLDTNLSNPVRLTLKLYLDDLADDQQLVVEHRYEAADGFLPFHAFNEIAPPIGRGSVSDPLILQLGLPASAVNGDVLNGPLKTHLYYGTDPVVPEPTSWMLALIGIAVASAVRRRRVK